MIPPRLFLRMSRWARDPPPMWKVKLVFGVILVGLVIAGVEYIIGWPDFLTLDPRPPRVPRMQ